MARASCAEPVGKLEKPRLVRLRLPAGEVAENKKLKMNNNSTDNLPDAGSINPSGSPRPMWCRRVSLLPIIAFCTLTGFFCLLKPLPLAAQTTVPRAKNPPEIRLYTLDCGRLDFDDMKDVSDTDDYAGQKGVMAVSCFLIRHGDEWLLWDAGLGDEIAALPNGQDEFGFHWTVTKTLRSQLAELKLKPGDIKYVALSHLHADHIGNVGLFPRATFLVSPLDLAWGRAVPAPPSVDPKLLQTLSRMKIKPVAYDLDVFGDGSVRMLRAAGHTPGHHFLMVKLPKAGAVMLSGDLYHFRRDYDESLLTTVNESRAETLASMERFVKLVKKYNARVVIQHAPEDFAGMPKFPAFLN